MILYSVSVGIALIVALAVFLSNPKRQINIFFALFVLMAVMWLFGVFLPQLPDQSTSVLYRLAIIFSTLMALMMYYFIVYLTENVSAKGVRLKIVVPTALAIVATLSPYVIVSTTKIQTAEGGSVIQPNRGFLYPVVIIWVLVLALSSLIMLYKHFRSTNDKRKRAQLRLTFFAFLAALIIATVTNILLPNISGDTTYNVYAPIALMVLTVIVGYTILRHRFLNIRLLVARSIAYILSLVFVGVAGAASLTVATSILFDTNFSTAEITISTLVVLVFSTLFQPFKHIFDNFTSRMFFREVYDSQMVLDELGSILATEINLQVIVDKSKSLIDDTLNPSYIRFVVFKDGESYIDEGKEGKHRRAVIRPEVDSFTGVLIVRDDATDKEKEYLDLYDADVLLKLRTNEETVGAVLLGPKQSGTIYSKQDIDLLTISEKELAIAVQNSRYFEQIQEFNIKLQHEVDQATSELRSSNEKLKALDEAKDEFVSMASHQLRTPLTSVKGYLSMAVEGDAGKLNPEQKKLLEEAFASSQRMVYLIADLLNVSRLKTGKFIIEPGKVNLPNIVKEEVQQLKPTASARKIKIVFTKPQRFPPVWLDETKIRQVIMNFIDNAIYYTKAGGKIEVRLVAKRDSIEFSVKDTGIGVPQHEQSKLFTKFFRADNARKARPDGTGLGLYMAQRVVSAQGGSIIFESEENKGSTFGFAFPLKKVREKPKTKVRARLAATEAEERE